MSARRFEFDGTVEEKGGQQFVNGRGNYGDGNSRILRIEPHGFASSPPKGAKGLILSPNGNPDEAYVLGGEHPGNRPGNLPGGGAAIYDAAGNIIKLVGTGIVVDVAGRTVTITAGTWSLTGNAVINGNLQVNGNVNVTGSVVDGDGDGGA